MLIDNKFELGIPTHIYFILYKFDHIDSMIISRVIKECKNWNTDTDESLFTVDVESFKSSLKGNKRLNKENVFEEIGRLPVTNSEILFIDSTIFINKESSWLYPVCVIIATITFVPEGILFNSIIFIRRVSTRGLVG